MSGCSPSEGLDPFYGSCGGGEPGDDEDYMPCPAAGGIPCGSDDCLRNGCVEQRSGGAA